ncbi:MAG: flippase-like domain-containing protein, partial [Alphaproteobacteria bacterium]|nr:flippase-like domain-containing protein [Alphaproteobacteria bacterium]
MTSGDSAARADAKGGRTKRWLLVLAKCGVSAGLLWALFASYDLADTLARIAAIDPGLFAVAFAGELVNVLLVTGRWLMVLGALGLTPGFAAALALVFIGLFFNQALPSNIGGDAMRVWRLFRTGSSLGRAVGSVMLD